MTPVARRVVAGVVCAALFLLSLAPYLVAATVLGTMNLVYFALVWSVYAAWRALFGGGTSLIVAFVCALALAVPPVPYYLGFLPDGSWHFSFIGWGEILDARFYALLALYLVAFLGFDLMTSAHSSKRPPAGAAR